VEIVTVTLDPRVYDRERAAWIAEQYADGDCSLRELSRLHPDRVPAPIWVYRWRRDYPDFDLAMQDAERVRAQNLADDILAVANDPAATAAQARNRMLGRQWLAERYDRDRYGNAARVDHKHSGSVTVDLPALSDEQLAAIAAQGRPALEGSAVRVQATGGNAPPGPPRVQARPPVAHIPSDPPLSILNFDEEISDG
jgi:hypothetical protein